MHTPTRMHNVAQALVQEPLDTLGLEAAWQGVLMVTKQA
jgi:hypothetical protein